MAILFDTNVLLRLAQKHYPPASYAARALDTLQDRNAELLITQQNIVEFWAVATRPLTTNGLNAEQTVFEIEYLKYLFRLLAGSSNSRRMTADCRQVQDFWQERS
jgi:predicted nucleic acid-binding protein